MNELFYLPAVILQETWEDVAEHASVFDFGDSGGILVMAQHQTHGPTSQVHFSMDEGLCWHSVDLEETIDVIGIKCGLTALTSWLLLAAAC